MRWTTRTNVVVISAAALIAAGGLPAIAVEDPAEEDTSTVEEFFDGLGVSEEKTAEAVTAFESLSPGEQRQVIETLQGDPPMDIFVLGEQTSTTTAAPRAMRGGTAANVLASARTYEVTSTYSVPVRSLGITFGSFNLKYRYQTGSNKVLKDYSCTAWRSGIAGYWNYSSTTDKWVSGGKGNCVALFTGSLIYQGSSITQNKEMGMIVNGPGIVKTWIERV